MLFAGLIEERGECEDVLNRVAEGIVLVNVATEVKGEVEEVFHVMGEEVAADVLAVLELFVEEADSEFQFSLFVFGNKNDERLGH